MELKQKYTEGIKEQHAQKAREIVEEVMLVSLSSKRRTREIVDGKMIYSKLLRERGYTLKTIGETLGKDHTTIIHYIRSIENLIETEPNINNAYAKCRDIFFEGEEQEPELDPEVLKIRIKQCTKEYDTMKVTLQREKEYNRRLKRLRQIVNMLDERIPKGKEDKYQAIINRVFNNIEDYLKE